MSSPCKAMGFNIISCTSKCGRQFRTYYVLEHCTPTVLSTILSWQKDSHLTIKFVSYWKHWFTCPKRPQGYDEMLEAYHVIVLYNKFADIINLLLFILFSWLFAPLFFKLVHIYIISYSLLLAASTLSFHLHP